MDFKRLATQILMDKIGSVNNSSAAGSALDNLANRGKGFDLTEIIGQFSGAGGDLAKKAKTWLGDGPNDAISPAQIQQVFGSDKLEAFASALGIRREEASYRLSEILPELIDKSSQGGSLLGAGGRAMGLAKLASRLFQ
jgi:uncharacterized protein YidB (DUF937 family)